MNIKSVYGVFSLGSAMLIAFRILQIIFATDLVTGFSEGVWLFDIILYVTLALIALLTVFVSYASQGYKGLEGVRLSKAFAFSSILLAIITSIDTSFLFGKKSDNLAALYYIELLLSLISIVALIYVAYGIFTGHVLSGAFKVCFVFPPLLYTAKLVIFFYEFSSISGVFSVSLSIIATAISIWFLYSITNLFLGNVNEAAIKKTIALGLLSTILMLVVSVPQIAFFLLDKHSFKIILTDNALSSLALAIYGFNFTVCLIESADRFAIKKKLDNLRRIQTYDEPYTTDDFDR